MGFSVYTFGGQLLSMHGDKGSHLVRYDNVYHYDILGNPFAVSHIHDNENGVDRELCWDDNGNLVKAISDGSNRYLCWTEDNRLQAFLEQGEQGNIAAWYNYSASGERNFKLASPRMSLQQNAEPFSNPPLVYPTLYASPLVTLTKHGYTKHYFEEGRRICSKIGGGLLGNVTAEDIEQLSPALADDYPVLYDRQRTGVVQTFRSCLGADPLLEDDVNFWSLLVEHETQRDDDEPAFSLRPNPARDRLTVERPDAGPATFEVFNAKGQKVLSQTSDQAVVTLDVSSLAAGSYLLRVTTAEGSSVRTFVVGR